MLLKSTCATTLIFGTPGPGVRLSPHEKDKPRQGVVANTLKLPRNGVVGFIARRFPFNLDGMCRRLSCQRLPLLPTALHRILLVLLNRSRRRSARRQEGK
jgi:hypothetical protein